MWVAQVFACEPIDWWNWLTRRKSKAKTSLVLFDACSAVLVAVAARWSDCQTLMFDRPASLGMVDVMNIAGPSDSLLSLSPGCSLELRDAPLISEPNRLRKRNLKIAARCFFKWTEKFAVKWTIKSAAKLGTTNSTLKGTTKGPLRDR